MNLETIAEKLKLSPSTVSRALRDCSGVNPKTRKRVLRQARALGYEGLKKNNVHGIALILPGNTIDEAHELASRKMITISNEIAHLGWQLYLVAIPTLENYILENRETWPKALNNKNVDCCIVLDMISSKAQKLLATHFNENVVMISRIYLENGVSGVGIDDYGSARSATEKLLKLGHVNIGWIGSLGSEDISRKRFAGVCSKLFEENLAMNAEVWLDERLKLDIESVGSVISAVLNDKKQFPTAWVASNDWLAANALLWFESQGMRCPDDFSLICFDDTKIAEALVQRKITSMISPWEMLAKHAVYLLKDRWEKRINEPLASLFPVSYRKGETVLRNKINE